MNTPQCAGTEIEPIEAIRALPLPNLIDRYRRGVEVLDPRVFQLTLEQADTAFLPDAGVGRWSVRVLMGHLADCELVYTHRIRRAVAEENPVLAVFDENAFVDEGLYGSGPPAHLPGVMPAGVNPALVVLGGFAAVIHTVRRWMADWLTGLEESKWSRAALHPERGEETVRHMVALQCRHVEHHARFLRLKIDRMLGPAGAMPCGAAPGGCGCSPKA